MSRSPTLTSEIAILGSGDVGSTIAYSLILNPVVGDVLLVDPKTEIRDAQVQDLADSTYYGDASTRVRAGTHEEAGQCDIVIITAGAKQKKGRNLSILRSAIDDMKPFREDTVILIVANPVDILTYFAQKFAGLPKGQVIGTGTFLDSARLHGILAQKAGVSASSIDAYVLGEHGESQVIAWSSANIGGVPVDKALADDVQIDHDAVAKETKQKAAAIIQSKGATAFGIGGVAASICKSILFDQRTITPISHYQEDLECCLSMPVVLGRKGVVRTIPIPLSEQEQEAVRASAKSLLDIIRREEKNTDY